MANIKLDLDIFKKVETQIDRYNILRNDIIQELSKILEQIQWQGEDAKNYLDAWRNFENDCKIKTQKLNSLKDYIHDTQVKYSNAQDYAIDQVNKIQ